MSDFIMYRYDDMVVNQFIIECIKNNCIVPHNFDFKQIRASESKWNTFISFITSHNLKSFKYVYVSYICDNVGDTVFPYTILVYKDMITIIYSNRPLINYAFRYTAKERLQIIASNGCSIYLDYFEAELCEFGVIAYDAEHNPKLYPYGDDDIITHFD